MQAKILASCLLLAAAACDNGDEDFEREIRGICDSIQLGTTTLREQSNAFGDLPLPISCESNLEPMPGEICTGGGGGVCQLRWQFPSRDCGPGGCTLACDVRTENVANASPPGLDTPICASRFLKQQPFVF
jgi:hypothetical protein